ncbi:hypothetical protein E2556_03590 [Staphylococcus croceilyticus]|uniref:Uncharacterized protein n=1 Tax=Staphylococcus croceilyticus TaxID=319942 RepID=A0ABY2KHI1_9STAP|nr:hypothetical protein CD128_00475 [Staphylococcus croceilyticus]TGA80168.1 hypothetical protein E2556_03590 [Staphylococcus croceilyticus]
MNKQKRVLYAHQDMLFYVSSPYSYSYVTRPLREQHSAQQYTTAIFVNSHKIHCTSIFKSVNTFIVILIIDFLK